MKHIILSIALLFTIECAFSQATSAERDSVAQTAPFQKKVRMATLKAANNILADPQQAVYTLNYGQVIISEPTGAGWLNALSYGCMSNPAINYDSPDSDIEFTVNSLFVKYAKAYYKITP
jgi:hypothetical protein